MIIIRHLLEMLLNPYLICLLLFTLFLIILWWRGNNWLVRWGFTLTLVLFLIFSTGWLPQMLTRKLEDRYPAITQVNPAIHWVVVLSGGQSEINDKPINAQLNSASIKRLMEGIRLYQQLPQAQLLLSGEVMGLKHQRLFAWQNWLPGFLFLSLKLFWKQHPLIRQTRQKPLSNLLRMSLFIW
ncbi:hypothetical protein clem_10660 [Legionella clemsonensis]|uniref:DUF218 domain-containing protein n=1 Tax=Legionella clemsonensis TaxID=1867846 RepID=A0A222P4A8_9GAMM|nr:hypothetical protein clem_10660 [Legionella clemsonensis]